MLEPSITVIDHVADWRRCPWSLLVFLRPFQGSRDTGRPSSMQALRNRLSAKDSDEDGDDHGDKVDDVARTDTDTTSSERLPSFVYEFLFTSSPEMI
jgi:hypothetical protein